MRVAVVFVAAFLVLGAAGQAGPCNSDCCTVPALGCSWENVDFDIDSGTINPVRGAGESEEELKDDFVRDISPEDDDEDERGIECQCIGSCCRVCTVDTNCNTCGGVGCSSGICTPGQVPACSAGLVCDPFAAPPNHCVECTDNSHCSGANCDLATNTCETTAGSTGIIDGSAADLVEEDTTTDDATGTTDDTTGAADDDDDDDEGTGGSGDDGANQGFFSSPGALVGVGALLAILTVVVLASFMRSGRDNYDDYGYDAGNKSGGGPRVVMSLSEIPGLKGNSNGSAQPGVLYSKPPSGGRKGRSGSRGRHHGPSNVGYGR